MDERRIAGVEDVPDDSTFLFTVRNGDDEFEAFLVRDADGVHAWKNHCQHWTDVRLDTGDGATMKKGEIVCERHGAYFESDTGYCNYGPCEGSNLEEVGITVENGDVYLSDGEVVERGSSQDGELSTRGGRDF